MRLIPDPSEMSCLIWWEGSQLGQAEWACGSISEPHWGPEVAGTDEVADLLIALAILYFLSMCSNHLEGLLGPTSKCLLQ